MPCWVSQAAQALVPGRTTEPEQVINNEKEFRMDLDDLMRHGM